MREGRRFCLFGGTFDPIHCAHIRIAERARQAFELDEILFVPAGTPPHKSASEMTPYEDRFRMVEIACRGFEAFRASRLESGAGKSYSVETVRRFRQTIDADDRIFFLIGVDAWADLRTWHQWQDLVKMTEFIVVTRPGQTYVPVEGAKAHLLEGLEFAVSSTDMRRRLASSELTPELDTAVRAYIDEHGLYRSQS